MRAINNNEVLHRLWNWPISFALYFIFCHIIKWYYLKYTCCIGLEKGNLLFSGATHVLFISQKIKEFNACGYILWHKQIIYVHIKYIVILVTLMVCYRLEILFCLEGNLSNEFHGSFVPFIYRVIVLTVSTIVGFSIDFVHNTRNGHRVQKIFNPFLTKMFAIEQTCLMFTLFGLKPRAEKFLGFCFS